MTSIDDKPAVKKSPPSKAIRSIQYDLFTQFVANDRDQVSNSIDIWESIPKYFLNETQADKLRTSSGHADPFEWSYHSGNSLFTIIIQPALLKENGKYKAYFPSSTEELIEEALKKFLTEQNLGIHNPVEYETWVRFTLKMIYKELTAINRSRTIKDIKRAIQVMSKCNLALYKDGKEVWSGSILQDLVTVDRDDYIDDPKAYHVARLPLFLSTAINKLQYRQYNYARLMKCKEQLAAWVYKKLINHYKQASLGNSYNILFSTLKESGLLLQKNDYDNRKKVKKALDQLVTEKILDSYDAQSKKSGQNIVDVKYDLFPSAEFVREQKAANKRAKDNHLSAIQNGMALDKF